MEKEDLTGYFIKIISSVHKFLRYCQNKISHVPVRCKMKLKAWFGFLAQEDLKNLFVFPTITFKFQQSN